MSLIKRKHEPTTTISVRIPVSLKAEFDNLRKLAEKADIDFTATLAGMISADFKNIRNELESLNGKASGHSGNGTAVSHKAEA
jgi:hypothetical protein